MPKKVAPRYNSLRDLNRSRAKNFTPHPVEAFQVLEENGVTTISQLKTKWPQLKNLHSSPSVTAVAAHAKRVLDSRASWHRYSKRSKTRTEASSQPQPQPQPKRQPAPPKKATTPELGGHLTQAVPRIRLPLSLLAQQYPDMEIEITLG